LDIKGLSFENSNDGYQNTLVEDCRTTGHGMMAIQGGNNLTNLVIRRCVITDGFNPGGHNSAPFVGLNEGARLTMEECVFDRNGYKENPSDATKWTGEYTSNLSSGGSGEPGTGVQPTRTWFDRNWYLSGNAGKTLIVRGNIAARTGGGAEQMRSGGLAYRNVFLFNHDGLLGGSNEAQYGFNDVFFVQNLFLHDDLFLPPGGWGMNNYLQGANTVIAENIYAHPHPRLVSPNGPGTLFLWNMRDNFQYPRVLVGNVIRAATPFRGFATQRSLGSLDHPIVTIKNNEFAINQVTSYGYGGVSRTAKSELDTIDENLYFGNETSATFATGYAGAPKSASRNKSFQTWQSAGYDINSQMISNWETFKSTAGWSDPERDIISYMQTIDPSYVPDENVRVDYGVPIQQSVPKLVKNSIPDSAMNEQQKILAAKRFHAAITFLLRARENRRGNWDSNYTAESLNDYIRSGFGKSSLSGSPYSLSLEDAFTFVSVEEPCLIIDLVPKTSSFTESGGTGSFTISTTNENCPWSAATNRDWLTLTQNASGTGSVAEISYSVAPNYTNSSRSGTITVGGQVHAVFQQSLVCTISSVEPTSISVGPSGGTGSISFSNASAICSWEAVSDSSWLTMVQGSTGTGESALIIYNVDQNPLNFSRVGTITLDDSNQISITQEGSPSLEIGNHVHKIKGSYSGQIERVFDKDYFLDLSVPVDRTITKIVTETSGGSCILEFYKNNDQITQIPASTTGNSITLSSNNTVSADDRLKIQINTNNRARGLKFSVHYEQESEIST